MKKFLPENTNETTFEHVTYFALRGYLRSFPNLFRQFFQSIFRYHHCIFVALSYKYFSQTLAVIMEGGVLVPDHYSEPKCYHVL